LLITVTIVVYNNIDLICWHARFSVAMQVRVYIDPDSLVIRVPGQSWIQQYAQHAVLDSALSLESVHFHTPPSGCTHTQTPNYARLHNYINHTWSQVTAGTDSTTSIIILEGGREKNYNYRYIVILAFYINFIQWQLDMTD